MGEIAIIRVRGTANVREPVRRTLNLLRLKKPNHMIIVEDSEVYKGMIAKAKDYITWGEVDKETLNEAKKRYDEKNKVYRLSPPRKGYGKGIKMPYNRKGALGYRGKDINELIKRMM